jgi:hypothetical protein
MLSKRRISMKAIDRSRNVARSWRGEIERDLFGVILVGVTFGRTGTQGRTIRRVVHDESAAMAVARRSLARRATAVKRCGVGYQVIECVGFDLRVSGH